MTMNLVFGSFLLWTTLGLTRNPQQRFLNQNSECQSILTGLCKGMYYDNTRMPNIFNHQTQEEALAQASIFSPWIQINCSEDLLLLICSTYFPICLPDHKEFLPPCFSLCERARNDCHASMQHVNFQWPANLACNQFPRYEDSPLCMEKNITGLHKARPEEKPASGQKEQGTYEEISEQLTPAQKIEKVNKLAERILIRNVEQERDGQRELKCDCSCRSPLVNLVNDAKSFSYRETFGSLESCSQQCRSPYISKEEDFKNIEFLQALLSSVTFICAAVNLVTFAFNRKSFPYPERSIIFISMCYLPISIGYLIRIAFGHEKTSCEEIFGVDQGVEILLPKKSLSGQGYCASVFLLTYFFSTSASLWWVVSTITWFLSTALKWSHESIVKYSQCFHFLAWCLSGVLTALVLMTSGVEGDPITGLCSINTNPDKNFVFLFEILPQVTFLGVGFLLYILGFMSIFRIRKSMKFENSTRSFEFLIMKMGLFGFFYLVAGVINVSLVAYRYRQERVWQHEVACDCTVVNLDDRTLSSYQKTQFNVNIINLKAITFFLIGIVSSCWIVSKRGFNTWISILNCSFKENSKPRDSKDLLRNMSQKTTSQWSKTFENSTNSSKTATVTPLPPVPLYNQTKQLSAYANSSSPLLYHQQFQQNSTHDQQQLISPISTSLGSSNGSQNQYYQLTATTNPSTNNTACSVTGASLSKYSKISNY